MFFCCQNLQVGDLLNFLSAIFFGIHMLRTEHISRCTKKENFLALIGYQVIFILQVLFFKTIFTKKKYFFCYDLIQISVVAVLSTLWFIVGGCLGVQGIEQSSWTRTELWDSIVEFPWLPALYTGVFSTALCLWVEVNSKFFLCYFSKYIFHLLTWDSRNIFMGLHRSLSSSPKLWKF